MTAGYIVPTNTQMVFIQDIDLTIATSDLTVSGQLQGVH